MAKKDRTARVEIRPISRHRGYFIGDDGSTWRNRVPRRRGGARDGFAWVESDELMPLRQKTNSYGYRVVGLREDNDKHKFVFVHVLVLETFVGPCPPGMQCRHLDGNRQNNRRKNLVWGTHAENEADRVRHGNLLRGSRHGMSKITEADISEIRRLRREGG